MGSIHKFTKEGNVIILQSSNRLYGTLVLIYGMLCTTLQHFIPDGSLYLFKFCLGECSPVLYFLYFLNTAECLFAFASALIILGISKSTFLITACNHDLRTT